MDKVFSSGIDFCSQALDLCSLPSPHGLVLPLRRAQPPRDGPEHGYLPSLRDDGLQEHGHALSPAGKQAGIMARGAGAS